jgi:bifunctional non-homologous end joining protein LigD
MSVAQRKPKRKTFRAPIAIAMPSSVDPMLPTPVKLPFSDPQWLFEPKLDGYRALCFLKDGKVRFISRNRRNLTKRFPELQEISTLIKARTAIIDGEIVALDRSGKPSFDALRYRPGHGAIVFYAFDLLYFDGHDVTQYPLVARKEALRRILRKAPRGRIRYTEHVEEQGERLFAELEAMQLEGMVCKRKDSVYASARSKHWLKVKTTAGRAELQKRIETWGK